MKRLPGTLIFGGVLTGLFVAAALLAPLIAPYGPLDQNLYQGLNAPGGDHL